MRIFGILGTERAASSAERSSDAGVTMVGAVSAMGAEWRRLVTTRAVMATAIRAPIAAARNISDRPSITAPQLPLNMVTLPGW
jgi:hypothetical protein